MGKLNKKLIEKYAKDSFELVENESETTTKIGGNPLVPANFSWPISNGEKIPFFMQVNFGEVNADKKVKYLPSSGILYIFLDDDVINSNYPLEKGEHYEVIYVNEGIDNLHEEESDTKTYEEKYFNVNKIKMYPNHEEFSDLYEYIEDADEDIQDEYFDNYHFIENDYGFLGGYPQIFQSSYLQDNESQLLQLESGDDYMWGDDGFLQFYMSNEALEKLDFTDVKINLETT
jgi:uncharacterized protein YwqG